METSKLPTLVFAAFAVLIAAYLMVFEEVGKEALLTMAIFLH
jgi:hypothetical protein